MAAPPNKPFLFTVPHTGEKVNTANISLPPFALSRKHHFKKQKTPDTHHLAGIRSSVSFLSRYRLFSFPPFSHLNTPLFFNQISSQNQASNQENPIPYLAEKIILQQ